MAAPAPEGGHRGEPEPIPDFCAHANRRSVASGPWSAETTWGGVVPEEGDGVIVSAGTELLYDQQSDVPITWITIRKNGYGKKGEFRAPLTTRVRASKINGRPVPDLQLFFEEQLEEPVGGVRASCGDRVDYVRGIACVIE